MHRHRQKNIDTYAYRILSCLWHTQVLKLQQRQSASDKTKLRRDSSMSACELDEAVVTQGSFIAEGGQAKVYRGKNYRCGYMIDSESALKALHTVILSVWLSIYLHI